MQWFILSDRKRRNESWTTHASKRELVRLIDGSHEPLSVLVTRTITAPRDYDLCRFALQRACVLIPFHVESGMAVAGPLAYGPDTACPLCWTTHELAAVRYDESYVPTPAFTPKDASRASCNGAASLAVTALFSIIQKTASDPALPRPWGRCFVFELGQGSELSVRSFRVPKNPACPCRSNYLNTGAGAKSESRLSHLFHDATKLRAWYSLADTLGEYNDECIFDYPHPYRWAGIAQGDGIALPSPTIPQCPSLTQTIRNRRSCRRFSGKSITQPQLAALCYYAVGVTSKRRDRTRDRSISLRSAPSGGGLNTVFLLLYVSAVEGMSEGLYYYDALQHALHSHECRRHDIASLTGYPEVVQQASVTFIIGCSLHRLQAKYKERGYRVAHVEAGHVAENLYLTSTALNLGGCLVMGIDEDAVADIARCDKNNEIIIALFAVGQREAKSGD